MRREKSVGKRRGFMRLYEGLATCRVGILCVLHIRGQIVVYGAPAFPLAGSLMNVFRRHGCWISEEKVIMVRVLQSVQYYAIIFVKRGNDSD